MKRDSIGTVSAIALGGHQLSAKQTGGGTDGRTVGHDPLGQDVSSTVYNLNIYQGSYHHFG